MLRIRDAYPGSRFLPISDPGSKNSNKREGWKNISCHTFLCSHKFHKIGNYFSFEVPKKKMWANFQRILELCTQKLSASSQKYGFGIRGSGKNLFRIPDPGVKKAPDPGSATLVICHAEFRCRCNVLSCPELWFLLGEFYQTTWTFRTLISSQKYLILDLQNCPPVLRIRDVYPGSRILIFTHPGSRIQKQQQKRGENILLS